MEAVKVDLVIIGAGPAGVMAAAWASKFSISTRVIDRNSGPVAKGQADGLQARTLEIFDSFGLAGEVLSQCCHDQEVCIWVRVLGHILDTSASNLRLEQKPDEIDPQCIRRTQRVLGQKPGISRYTQITINQGRIERTFNNFIEKLGILHVERNIEPEELSLVHDSTRDEYPITLKVRHATKITRSEATNSVNGHSEGESEQIEVIKAKYLLGCDGARSWTRHQLGLSLEGKQAEGAWGVMDIIPLTNFRKSRSCGVFAFF